MRILILDKDTEYSKRFKHYLEKKYSHLQIVTFDNFEAVNQQLQKEVYDIILFDALCEDVSIEEIAGNSAFAYISGNQEIVNEQETIFKYSSVSELYSLICNVYETQKKRIVRTENSKKNNMNKTEIITFLPVHGGAGSSTIAAACAIALSEESDVLYINMEQKTSDMVFFEGESNKTFTDVISAMKTKYDADSIKLTLEQVIQKDIRNRSDNLSYVKGYNNIMDCISIQPSHIDFILKILREKFNYRYIIIDTDFIVSEVLQRIICLSDKLVFVLTDSDISNMKLSKIQRYLDVMSRESDAVIPEKYLVLNQYYGMLNGEQNIMNNIEIIAKFMRYRMDDGTRITSQRVIQEIVSGNKGCFDRLM